MTYKHPPGTYLKARLLRYYASKVCSVVCMTVDFNCELQTIWHSKKIPVKKIHAWQFKDNSKCFQQKRIRYPEINPCILGQLVFSKNKAN